MTEGELLQLTLLGEAEVTEDEYLDVLERKDRRTCFSATARLVPSWEVPRRDNR
jgi:hypothetical protein